MAILAASVAVGVSVAGPKKVDTAVRLRPRPVLVGTIDLPIAEKQMLNLRNKARPTTISHHSTCTPPHEGRPLPGDTPQGLLLPQLL